jgi:hypothetical protein
MKNRRVIKELEMLTKTQIVGLSLFLSLQLTAFNSQASCGKFLVVKGDISVEFTKNKKIEKAHVNSEICSGDTVSAGKDSRAKIVMVDNNELNISPDSKIQIEAYDYKPTDEKKKVLLNVLYGKLRSTVKQKYDDKSKDGQANTFEVKTKSAVAGVRGTDFLTGYNAKSGHTEVVTFAGRVDVGQLGPGGKMTNSVSVGPGQKTESAPGQPPHPPVAVPTSELKSINKESRPETADSSSNGSKDSGGAAKKDGGKDKDSTKPAAADEGASTGSGSTSGSGQAQTSAPAPAGDAAPPPPSARMPASTSGGTMLDSSDLGGGAGAKIPDFSKSPASVTPSIPVLPVVQAPPPCNFCNQAIKTGPSNVHINIQQK